MGWPGGERVFILVGLEKALSRVRSFPLQMQKQNKKREGVVCDQCGDGDVRVCVYVCGVYSFSNDLILPHTHTPVSSKRSLHTLINF